MAANRTSGNAGWKALQETRRREAMTQKGITSDWIEARYDGVCKLSGLKYHRGERIAAFRGLGFVLESVISRILAAETAATELAGKVEETKALLAEGIFGIEDEEVFAVVSQVVLGERTRCVACACCAEVDAEGKVVEHANAFDPYYTGRLLDEGSRLCWGSRWEPRKAMTRADLPAEWVAVHQGKIEALIERQNVRFAKNAETVRARG